MEPKTLLTANYLDIIFDGRNKTYGSYELRQHYNQRVGKACACLVSGIAALIFASFIITGRTANNAGWIHTTPTIITDITQPVLPPKVILPPQRLPSPPPQPIRTKILTPPIITEETVPDDKQMTRNKDMQHSIAGPANAEGDSVSIDIVPVKTTTNKTGVTPTETVSTVPRHFVEQAPLFSGDLDAYIGSHLRYPETARNSMVEGRVVIEFVVNEDGSVSNAKVMRSIGGGCDEEALRMVSNMPKWKPGKQNGVPVKVFFSLSIKFELQ